MKSRKLDRQIRRHAIEDLYIAVPRDQRLAFHEYVAGAINANAKAIQEDKDLSSGQKAKALAQCIASWKELGEIAAISLKAEELLRSMNVANGTASYNVPHSLMEFIPKVSPQFQAPHHLSPMVDVLESSLFKEQRYCFSTPPQHSKTTTLSHYLVWFMLKHPGTDNAYVSYGAERAQSVSAQMQQIARAAGAEVTGTRAEWKLSNGSRLRATGIDGGLNGYPVSGVAVIDDPYKGMADANSPVMRERVMEWFQSVLMARVHKGASVINTHTRWHPEDLTGVLLTEGWSDINLPAINEANAPLWPEKWPLDLLTRRRIEVGEHVWSALYMGQPRPRGGSVFDITKAPTYHVLPDGPRRTFVGIDMAYTASTYADYSVALVLVECNGEFYIAEVVREQVAPPVFRTRVDRIQYEYPNSVLAVSAARTEVGSAHFLADSGMPLSIQTASADKFLRSQPVAAAWNAGKIHIPADAHWLSAFKREVANFTGLGGQHDDQVDALGAAFNAAVYGSVSWDSIESSQRSLPKPISLGLF